MAAESDYIVVALVEAAGVSRELKCLRPLSPREANLIYVLGECVGRPVSMDELSHRLQMAPGSIRVSATLVRKKLHYDWAIDSPRWRGMRLLFIGDSLAKADRTKVALQQKGTYR